MGDTPPIPSLFLSTFCKTAQAQFRHVQKQTSPPPASFRTIGLLFVPRQKLYSPGFTEVRSGAQCPCCSWLIPSAQLATCNSQRELLLGDTLGKDRAFCVRAVAGRPQRVFSSQLFALLPICVVCDADSYLSASGSQFSLSWPGPSAVTLLPAPVGIRHYTPGGFLGRFRQALAKCSLYSLLQ